MSSMSNGEVRKYLLSDIDNFIKKVAEKKGIDYELLSFIQSTVEGNQVLMCRLENGDDAKKIFESWQEVKEENDKWLQSIDK